MGLQPAGGDACVDVKDGSQQRVMAAVRLRGGSTALLRLFESL
jgi:hypothetical protein